MVVVLICVIWHFNHYAASFPLKVLGNWEQRNTASPLESGTLLSLQGKADIHAVCSTLKSFLRSLSETLITKSLWGLFVKAAGEFTSFCLLLNHVNTINIVKSCYKRHGCKGRLVTIDTFITPTARFPPLTVPKRRPLLNRVRFYPFTWFRSP